VPFPWENGSGFAADWINVFPDGTREEAHATIARELEMGLSGGRTTTTAPCARKLREKKRMADAGVGPATTGETAATTGGAHGKRETTAAEHRKSPGPAPQTVNEGLGYPSRFDIIDRPDPLPTRPGNGGVIGVPSVPVVIPAPGTLGNGISILIGPGALGGLVRTAGTAGTAGTASALGTVTGARPFLCGGRKEAADAQD